MVGATTPCGRTVKEQFIDIYTTSIDRPGADKFLAWLSATDFFTAPASTRYHLSREGGLAEHSLNVYYRLRRLVEEETGGNLDEADEEHVAIVALLHDVCKANYYGVEMRNRKNEAGIWEKVPFYVVNDQLPFGHGEKSVYLINQCMPLTAEETMAIRLHMGYSDNDFKAGGQSVSNAFNRYPLAVLLHIADLMASHIDEAEDQEDSKNG